MFDHLLNPETVGIDAASLEELLSAQATTTQWCRDMGVPDDLLSDDETEQARNTFQAVTTPTLDPRDQKNAALALRTPAAVRHLAGMLSQYDWAFVEQAKELRGYVVAKLLEETKHQEARVRLRALEMVGKLTEVGSFTERIEITKKDDTADALTARLREKLEALRAKAPKHEAEIAEVLQIAEPAAFEAPGPAYTSASSP